MNKTIEVIVLVCLGLILAIILNVFTIVRGAEPLRLVPVKYHKIHTVHYFVQPKVWGEDAVSVRYTEETGLRDYKPQQIVSAPAPTKEHDQRLIITTSIISVFMTVIGLVCGYELRKTN